MIANIFTQVKESCVFLMENVFFQVDQYHTNSVVQIDVTKIQ